MHGRLVVVTGPMFAGKSSRLLLETKLMSQAGHRAYLFRPAVDTRARTHAGERIPSVAVETAREIIDTGLRTWYGLLADPGRSFVAIDEAQFLSGVASVAAELRAMGYQVLAAGLDLDFRGEPFEEVARLMAYADEVVKLAARCERCGAAATRTYRRVQGGPRVLVGGADLYEARCIACWAGTTRNEFQNGFQGKA